MSQIDEFFFIIFLTLMGPVEGATASRNQHYSLKIVKSIKYM